jgi:hypothetical protein
LALSLLLIFSNPNHEVTTMCECELCGGPLLLLGQLGGRVHLTCRDCGMAYNHEADEDEGQNHDDEA